jgi:short-subunit dehydrogenase
MRKKLSLLAAVSSAFALYQVVQWRRRQTNAREWNRARPARALVTGASSGIGAVFARQLAHQGYDLVVLARREDRLRALAEELQRDYGAQVQVLAADLSSPDDVERVAQQVAAMEDLELLVNNAGYGVGGRFSEIDARMNMDNVQVNLVAPVRLARAALPGMIRRGRGGIINVSSVASFLPASGNHTYGATKAYLNFLSESLQMELAGTGVRVQALCPGYTHTEFHDSDPGYKSTIPGILWLNAEDVVAESLRGLREGRLYVVPGAIYKLAVFVLNIPGMRPLVRLAERLLRFRRFSAPRES